VFVNPARNEFHLRQMRENQPFSSLRVRFVSNLVFFLSIHPKAKSN